MELTKTNISISPVDMAARKEIDIKPGDTVRVHQKIEEKGKTRLQIFEGLVLAVKHGKEAGSTFTVRKVASGVGMERIFPLYSPVIEKIEIVKRSKVRRAKLYYIREKVAREIRRKMRRMMQVSLTTVQPKKKEAVVEEAPKEDDKAEASDTPVETPKEEAVEVKEVVVEEKKEEAPKEEEKKEGDK